MALSLKGKGKQVLVEHSIRARLLCFDEHGRRVHLLGFDVLLATSMTLPLFLSFLLSLLLFLLPPHLLLRPKLPVVVLEIGSSLSSSPVLL